MIELKQSSFPIAPASTVVQLIEDAFLEKKSFSLIRLGDGESTVLGYPQGVHDKRFTRWMRSFFGNRDVPNSFYEPIKEYLAEAIKIADVVGVYDRECADYISARDALVHLGAREGALSDDEKRTIAQLEWGTLSHLVKPLITGKIITSTGIHKDLERSGLLKRLIEKSNQINLITGSVVVGDRLSDAFSDKKFHVYNIPSEYRFRENKASSAVNHFPEVFDDLLSLIQRGDFGGLTLVGAGPCGKIYCSKIGQMGGFALDIGSIMDLWEGRKTRGYMDNFASVTI